MKGVKRSQDTLDEGLEKVVNGEDDDGLLRKIEDVERSDGFRERASKIKQFLIEKGKELQDYVKSGNWSKARNVCEYIRRAFEDEIIREAIKETAEEVVKDMSPIIILYAMESIYPSLPREAGLAIRGASIFATSLYFNKRLREKWGKKWEKYNKLSQEHGDKVMFGYYKSLGKGRLRVPEEVIERIEKWKKRALTDYSNADIEIFVPDLTTQKVNER